MGDVDAMLDDRTAERPVIWKPVGRRDFYLTMNADIEGLGLEIGAANNPVVRGARCRYADYADTRTLRERFQAANYDGADRIVDVDYVWPGSGPLAPIIGDDRFDYVIASHVIEHVPNPLGWFRGIAEVMTPGAVFNLAIPDRRFTFDIGCPESSLGELVEADILGYLRPSPRQIFDACYYGKAVDPGEPWARAIDPEDVPAYSGDIAPQLAYDQAVRSQQGIYYDAHCWVFTPRSFLLLLRGACQLGLFDLVPVDFHPTVEGEFEFFLNLEKPREPMEREALIALQLQRIAFFLFAIAERDRKLQLLID